MREMMYGFRDEFIYIECSECGCLQIAEIPEDISNSRSVIHSGLLVLLIEPLVLHYARKKRKIVSVWI